MIMEVRIQTLTPLWTGGVDGSMDRTHETGIIGSMRWWYEAIVRGLGGKACDPTSNNKCSYDPKDFRPPEQQLCPVCYVFGSTGWRRRFRLDIVDNQTKPAWMGNDGRAINIRPPDRTRGWFLPPGRMGNMSLCLDGDKQVLDLLAALLLFIEKWGNLSAKPQLGYGVFKIVNRDEIKERAIRYPWQVIGASFQEGDKPDMRSFGFLRYNFLPKDSAWWMQLGDMERVGALIQTVVATYKTVPTAPALKNEWRFHQWHGSLEDEKWMFGTLQWRDPEGTKRLRSKVAVSWAYSHDKGWVVRVWGWMQKPQIASMVWDLLRDTTAWEKALHVPGTLEIHPSGNWCEWMPEDVARFLEEVKCGSIPSLRSEI